MNVVLITIDCLRMDAVSAYGFVGGTTPNIDALASKGLLFTQAISPNICTPPSMASIMTGLYPSFVGVNDWGPATWCGLARFRQDGEDPDLSIPGKVETLPEVLREAGLKTYGFNTNTYLLKKFGFARGFDLYDDFEDFFATEESKKKFYPSASMLTDRVLDTVDFKSPFFVWAHYMDTHTPWYPPEAYKTRYCAGEGFSDDYVNERYNELHLMLMKAEGAPHGHSGDLGLNKDCWSVLDRAKALYLASLSFVDEQIKRVLARLRDEGVSEETLVIITADHGEDFFEAGNISHHGMAGATAVLTRVPLVVVSPSGPWGMRVHEQARCMDIAPTVLDATGIDQGHMDGESLLADLRSKEFAPVFHMSLYNRHICHAVRTRDWKLTVLRRGGEILTPVSRRASSFIGERGRIIDELLGCYNDFKKTHGIGAELKARKKDLDSDIRERLRGLGYIE